jgi:CRP-like cAMP-binding protein
MAVGRARRPRSRRVVAPPLAGNVRGMTDPELVSDLRLLPHFRALPVDLVEAIAAGSRRVAFRTGQSIFGEGEPVRAFYSVRRGAVKVYRLSSDGREQVLHHLGEGRTFAEAAVLSMTRYPAHAVAVAADTELIEIGAERFLALFRSDPRLAAAMVSSLSMWLISLTERVEELSLASATARLAHYLLRLPSRVEGAVAVLELPLAKKELAAHLAITPETLSRLLRRWQDAGLVRSEGRRLEVLDERLLEAIANHDEHP